MFEKIPQKIAEDKIEEMFGKRKEDMTLDELLANISLLSNMTGNKEIEKTVNDTLAKIMRGEK